LVGLFGQGNLGNDGSLEAMLAYLRRTQPNAVLDVLCTRPDRVSERYGVRAASLRWYEPSAQSARSVPARATRAFRTALGIVVDAYRTGAWVRRHDVVIVPGMGVLEATLPLRPWKTPYLMFLTSAFGRLFGVRVAFVSVGSNVINQRVTRRLVVGAARSAHYRSFRDLASRNAMSQMKVDVSNDHVYPDLAFSLPLPGPSSVEAASVGVGIMDYSGSNDDRHRAGEINDRYTNTMTRFVLALVDEKRPVRLLAGDIQDQSVIARVLAEVRSQRPELDSTAITTLPASSLTELMQQINGVDTVVATRFHTVLCALRLGKPTLAVGYGAKFSALMTELGVGDFSLPAQSVDSDDLCRCFARLERERDGYLKSIAERGAALTTLVYRQFDALSRAAFDSSEASVRSPASAFAGGRAGG
jgi:polysaccharide pyruvyl transferase WcaK-like protein